MGVFKKFPACECCGAGIEGVPRDFLSYMSRTDENARIHLYHFRECSRPQSLYNKLLRSNRRYEVDKQVDRGLDTFIHRITRTLADDRHRRTHDELMREGYSPEDIGVNIFTKKYPYITEDDRHILDRWKDSFVHNPEALYTMLQRLHEMGLDIPEFYMEFIENKIPQRIGKEN